MNKKYNNYNTVPHVAIRECMYVNIQNNKKLDVRAVA